MIIILLLIYVTDKRVTDNLPLVFMCLFRSI